MSLPLAALLVTLGIFFLGIAFKLGQHSARLESLEAWRINIRNDMFQISEKLETISADQKELKTLIEERTERRLLGRPRET